MNAAPAAAVLSAALVLLLPLRAAPARAQELEPVPVAVVLLAGYGTDLAGAQAQFAPLRAALAERNPAVVIVQYSYTGTSFDGCLATPAPYAPSDTAQDIEVSKQILRDTLVALRDACDVPRIAIVGHSLGGLIAFQALDGLDLPGLSDLVTVDSPLGGVPRRLVQTCIDLGFCADGAIVDYLAELYATPPGLAQDNAARAAALDAASIRVSAWGNQSDCFYNVALCATFARALLGTADARETQWLGIPRAVRRDYPVPRGLANISASHTALLTRSATELAAAILP